MRQFHNQPAESPLHKSLVAMWEAVKNETHGRVDVQTFPENDHTAGGDPAVLTMLIDGKLDFFTLNGGLIGAVVPAVNVQGIPFAFQNLEQVFIGDGWRAGRLPARRDAREGNLRASAEDASTTASSSSVSPASPFARLPTYRA